MGTMGAIGASATARGRRAHRHLAERAAAAAARPTTPAAGAAHAEDAGAAKDAGESATGGAPGGPDRGDAAAIASKDESVGSCGAAAVMAAVAQGGAACAVRMVRDVASALVYLHEHGRWHRGTIDLEADLALPDGTGGATVLLANDADGDVAQDTAEDVLEDAAADAAARELADVRALGALAQRLLRPLGTDAVAEADLALAERCAHAAEGDAGLTLPRVFAEWDDRARALAAAARAVAPSAEAEAEAGPSAAPPPVRVAGVQLWSAAQVRVWAQAQLLRAPAEVDAALARDGLDGAALLEATDERLQAVGIHHAADRAALLEARTAFVPLGVGTEPAIYRPGRSVRKHEGAGLCTNSYCGFPICTPQTTTPMRRWSAPRSW